MKRSRIIFVALLLACFAIFTSCTGTVKAAKSFDVILNKDYDPKKDTVNSADMVEELSGYSLFDKKSEFMIFNKTDENGVITSKVFSARNKKVVLTVVPSTDEAIEIMLYPNVSCFAVSKTKLGDGNFASVRELYDAEGTLVTSTSSAIDPIAFADMVLFDKTAYSVDRETGALEKLKDIPVNLYIDSCDDWNSKYFYRYDESINIYDRDFNHIYSFTLPSWAEWRSRNLLNDGKIMVQYSRILDPNSNKYDFGESDPNSGELTKYELYTYIIDPEKKTEKALDFKYMIEHISTGSELVDKDSDNNMYVDSLENIAYLYPIVDHMVDYSGDKTDVVLIDNNGKIKNTLKIVDDQRANIPVLLGDGVYLVSTVYGMALVDIEGNLLRQINNYDIDVSGENIICDGIIYTFDMEAVYSLPENNAGVITHMNDTVFVKKGSDEDYSVLAVTGKEVKELCSYRSADPSSKYFEELPNSSCYALLNAVEGKYNYYNTDHKLILESNARIELAGDFDEFGTFVYTAVVDGIFTYYIFY